MKHYYIEEEEVSSGNGGSGELEELEYGCQFCWDGRKKKEKELMFFDPANNMRVCKFCPWCGREYLTQED